MTGNATAPTDTQPILNAASILLVDTAVEAPRVLMGLRQATNVFLPNKWVFPGGRLEAEDALVHPATPLHTSDEAVLAARLAGECPPVFPQSLAIAAVRELFEETGHAIGVPAGPADPLLNVWPAFQDRRLRPSLAPLRFIARAITPPGRTRRYDTRFFIAPRAEVIEGAAPADEEFSDLNWFTIAEARVLDLPNITRRILADLESLLLSGSQERGSVPFYYEDAGVYRRDLIARTPAPA